MIMAMPIIALMTSCEPKAMEPEQIFVAEASLDELLKAENPDGQYKIYDLNDFVDAFMTEDGSFPIETYRQRSYDDKHHILLYSVDTIRKGGPGIYIRGRISTDDYGGNFYKALVIQQIVNGEQQNLRISVDLGSAAGLYQMGQEIMIRCNGLAVGRYANQPQLCVPSYNNNIFAQSAEQKVGWNPGRIPGSVFRSNTRMIGLPAQNKLKYEEMTLAELFTLINRKPSDSASVAAVRKMDGMLVKIKDVRFTGLYRDNNTIAECVAGDPDPGDGSSHSEINVFAPSTGNIGFPQSRIVGDIHVSIADIKNETDQTNIMFSNSEYAKFAHYYLPGADKTGITQCQNFEGTITGILGWYLDKAETLKKGNISGYEWSITPRGIPGLGVPDIEMYYEGDKEQPWIPQEYDPNNK